MSHDWMSEMGLSAKAIEGVTFQALDEHITGQLQKAARRWRDETSLSFEFEAPMMAQRMRDLVDQIYYADREKLEQAARDALELGVGVLVVREEGRVAVAEASPYVPANQAYYVDKDYLDAFLERAVSDGPFSRDYDPEID